MTPHRGNTILYRSSQQRALLPELQRYKDTVRCAALGAEVPGHRQEQLTQILIERLLKAHLYLYIHLYIQKLGGLPGVTLLTFISF